eukprot:3841133-Rhodomonas_salina.2
MPGPEGWGNYTRLLLSEPDMLLLDEPTNHLDSNAKTKSRSLDTDCSANAFSCIYVRSKSLTLPCLPPLFSPRVREYDRPPVRTGVACTLYLELRRHCRTGSNPPTLASCALATPSPVLTLLVLLLLRLLLLLLLLLLGHA